MKKNIGDTCKDCIIEIPDELYHKENLLIRMIDSFSFPDKEVYNFMKQSFPGKSAVCIKKDTGSIIGQEYYFIPQVQSLTDIAKKLSYPLPQGVHMLDYAEYSFDYHGDCWELNLFDNTTAAYYLKGETLSMKNIYFGFRHEQKSEALDQMKKSVFPFTDEELKAVLSWTQFQRKDGNILIGRKKNAESVFFSRINFLGFLYFIKQFGWEEYLGDFLSKNANYLKYYLFDINLQYTYKNGKISIEKTSIYGLI